MNLDDQPPTPYNGLATTYLIGVVSVSVEVNKLLELINEGAHTAHFVFLHGCVCVGAYRLQGTSVGVVDPDVVAIRENVLLFALTRRNENGVPRVIETCHGEYE